ncbi:uncharacterized protein LOC128261232 [Drosophila gunungcola]|uniref:Uncharacterized protein n=1 Tax=Drosophila gunungcola TaxID=103775 RepID=A0A9Q0BS96_9MUSC|nr:uncharacterized protein LOC128261232 [Drosophila gunungcola]XP_052850777.1 uncharacterized protein LOC128261232 [Drosophila gunungcola]KAI8042306.1 hypothetical protein M5D96_003608 [Drosophila gunungcola]
MPPVLRKKLVKRSTPGRGNRNAFQNFLACCKQENGWIRNDKLQLSASAKWNKFDTKQRGEFSYNRYKVNMPYKLDLATLDEIFEGPYNLRSLDNGEVRVIESARNMSYSSSSISIVQTDIHSSSEINEVRQPDAKLNEIEELAYTEEPQEVEGPKKRSKRAKKIPKKLNDGMRKPVKRLKENPAKKRGSTRNDPAVQNKRLSLVGRKTSSFWTYKNFLRRFRQANPGRMAVEAATMWRKMSLEERDEFRGNSLVKRKTAISTQFPEEPFEYSESGSDMEPMQQASDGQLPVSTDRRESRENKRGFLSQALKKVKSFFY